MRYAWQALRRRPGRSLATAFGIGLATALVILLLSLSSGIQSSSSRLAAASGVDLLAASANTSIASTAFPPVTSAHGLPAGLSKADPNVGTASPWLLSSLVFANSSLYQAVNSSSVPGAWGPTGAGSVGWIPEANRGIETPTVYAGTGFDAQGDPHYANGTYRGPLTHEVVLDDGLASLLNVSPGAVVWVSTHTATGPGQLPDWFRNATAFRVVGVSGPFWLIPTALLAFFYLSELQQVVAGGSTPADDASLVLVHLTDPSHPVEDQATLERAYPQLAVFTVGNIIDAINQVVDLYRTFGTLIGLIGVVVATLFTTTVLLMSVDDRSQELALLRALGFSRPTIAGYVAEEGILLSLGGLAVGLVGGGLGAFFLNGFLTHLVNGLPAGFSFVTFDSTVVTEGLVEVLLIGLVASALPIWRALTLPVVEELRAP